MRTATQTFAARETVPDHEQKQLALGYLQEAWTEARHDGVEGDCLAQTALFLALVELISTYGEEAAVPLRGKPRPAHPQRRIFGRAVAAVARSAGHLTLCRRTLIAVMFGHPLLVPTILVFVGTGNSHRVFRALVATGLDPVAHTDSPHARGRADCRVKPGNDDETGVCSPD